MIKGRLKTLTQKKLKRWLLLFFTILLLLTAVLVQQSYSRLKWETFHQHQQMAQALTSRIDDRLIDLVNKEDQRPFSDYTFLNVAGDIRANFLQRSPLSTYPVVSDISGLLGYFQVDDSGVLETPLLPSASPSQYGITAQEQLDRVALKDEITAILAANKLITQSPTHSLNNAVIHHEAINLEESADMVGEEETYQPQIAFERLTNDKLSHIVKNKLGRIDDLQMEPAFRQKSEMFNSRAIQVKEKKVDSSKRVALKQVGQARNEKISLPDVSSDYSNDFVTEFSSVRATTKPVAAEKIKKVRIRTFESEIDPFEFSQLDSGHFVLFRKVWLNGQRYVQGLLIDSEPFINDLITRPFKVTSLASMSELLVVHQGKVLTPAIRNATEQLYRSRVSAPFGQLQLIYRITTLPIGAGGKVVLWLGLILTSVLLVGFYLMYRLGAGQIKLAHQQQDFVSAVSHELKTPLTSIRMFSEMLREGWTPEEKRRDYYDFIFDESERLSRLINNVLQLARLTRNAQQAELSEHEVQYIMQTLQSKVSAQVDRAGFKLMMSCDESAIRETLLVDIDWLTQVIINLVDNAVKFSAKALRKEIMLTCGLEKSKRITITVRDFGPGIDAQQMKQVFELFYRSESELTRETTGTGIGLSLVQQMVTSMKGKVNVNNVDPGVEFTVSFPLIQP